MSQLLERSDAEIAQDIVDRAERNPFFVGEMVRTVIARAAQEQQAASAELPDTVQATVLARLDLLDPAARRFIQVGSVFGRSFGFDGLAAAEPELAPRMGELVESLVEHDLLDASRGEIYVFRHILLREVAYGTLPRAERARLHRAAATWLAAQAEGREHEMAELVALHYRQAAVLGRATSQDTSEIEASAVAWLVRAGDAAASAAAFIEAANHLRHAIELAPPGRLPELHAMLGKALGAGDRAADAYLTAARLGREQHRDANFLLRNLSSALCVYSRWFASVAAQPSRAEIDRLRAEARALLPEASDETGKAIFFMSEGFFPYWVRNSGLESSTDEIADSEASARAALEIADPCSAGYLRAERRVLHLPVDSRAAWQLRRSGATGRGGDCCCRVSARGCILDRDRRLGGVRPLSVGPMGRSAHLVGSGARLLDRCRASAGRLEPARVLLGPGGGSCAAGRASGSAVAPDPRGDHRCVRPRSSDRGPDGHCHPRRRAPCGRGRDATGSLPHRALVPVEHVLGIVVDRNGAISLDALENLAGQARSVETPLLEAQARRALGVLGRRPDELHAAIRLFEGMRVAPYVARAQIELGQLLDDEDQVGKGSATLRALGDVDHLARIGLA